MTGKYEKEFKNAYAALLRRAPFIGSLLSKCTVVFTDAVKTAGVNDEAGILAISKTFWDSLSPAERLGVLAHEVLHVAFMHVMRGKRLSEREKRFGHLVWNVACDVVINEILVSHGFTLPSGVTAESVARLINKPADEVRRMSAEELFEELLSQRAIKSNYRTLLGKTGEDLKESVDRSICGKRDKDKGGARGKEGSGKTGEKRGEGGERAGREEKRGKGGGSEGESSGGESRGRSEGEGEIVHRGDAAQNRNREEAERFWRRAIAEAYVFAKIAGNVPGAVERIVSRILKNEVDWRRELRAFMNTALGRMIRMTWRRTSRKNPHFPSYRRIGVNRVWALVDVSGSISEVELQRMVSEVYAIARAWRCPVVLVAWDAEIQGIWNVRSPEDVKRIKITGGGGTLLCPALRYVANHAKLGDVVVVMSDFELGDPEEAEKLLTSLCRAVHIVALTTTGTCNMRGFARVIPVKAP